MVLRVTETYLGQIGGLIRDARKHRGLTQTQLADVLGTSQSAVHRIEAGNQNLSLEMVNRIAAALDSTLISVGGTGPQHDDVIVCGHGPTLGGPSRRRPPARCPALGRFAQQ